MLYINAQKGQSIFIGIDHTITINSFDENVLNATLSSKLYPGTPNINIGFETKAGDTMKDIIEEVDMQFVQMKTDGVEYAVLAFEAPRSIRIIGDWQTGNRDPGPADRKKLSNMSDASLVYYSTINGKTPLENELTLRFKRLIRS